MWQLTSNTPEGLVKKCYPNYLELGYAGLKKARYEILKKHSLISHEATEVPFNNLTKKWLENQFDSSFEATGT